VVAIEEAVVVDVHPLGEARVGVGLDLHVDQDPGFLSATEPDPDQLVHRPRAEHRVAYQLVQLLIQKHGLPAPVDLGLRLGEEEREERLEVGLEDLFPGAVLFVGDRGPRHGARQSKDRARALCPEPSRSSTAGWLVPAGIRSGTSGIRTRA
jgi:hypothetical protein